MITCGIDIKSSTCILLALTGSVDHYEVIDCPKKIEIKDASNTDQIRDFLSQLTQLFSELNPDKIIIKKRLEKGKFAGGPSSFKIEALIQVASQLPTSLISGPELKRLKAKTTAPTITKYQEDAFFAAYSALS
jgi:hypothetical protein